MCLQPATPEYRFLVTYNEAGEEVTKTFCGALCLRQWIEKELDKVHLTELCTLE